MSIGGDGYGERDRTGHGGPEYGHDSGRLTTRTHLPEGESGTRSAPRPGKSLLTVVGVVVLLIAAIAFANQGGGESEESTGADGTGGGAAEAQPTQPSGEKPVENVEGKVASDFPHTKQGAESAAANYASVLGGDEMFRRDTRHQLVDAIYTTEAAAKLKPPQDKAYSPKFLAQMGLNKNGDAPKGKTFVSRTIPVGTKTSEFSQNSATVSVWYTGLIGMAGTGSTDPVRTDWKTWTFKLKWSDGDWKVVTDKQKNGPAPVQGDVAAASAEDISKAVGEFGGFTYAR